MAYQSIFQNPNQVVNPKRTPDAALPALRSQPGVSTMPQQPAAQPGQISMQQFAQSIKQKYPQYQNQDDTKLATAFLQKYPQYAAKVTGAPASGSGEQPYKEPGFFQKLVQGVASPFARLGVEAYNTVSGVGKALGGDIAGANAELDKTRDLGYLGQTAPTLTNSAKPGVKELLDVAGQGIELGTNFIGGTGAVKTGEQVFKNALVQSAKTGAKYGAGVGATYGFGSSLTDQENQGVGNTLKQTALGGLTGGLTGGLLGAGGTLASRGAQYGAEKLGANPFLQPRPSVVGLLKGGVGQVALGTDVAEAASVLAEQPKNVKAFQTGSKTFETIAGKTRQAVTSLEEKSKAAFDLVKNDLPDNVQIGKLKTQKTLNQFLPKKAQLTPGEVPQINKLRNAIMANKDWSVKGLWALRNKIDRSGIYRDSADYITSNRALTSVRDALNKLIIDKAPYMEKVFANASNDIQFLDKLETNLVGKNPEMYVERTATNLNKIMNKLDDPTQYKATHDLIQELEDRTGINLTEDLKAAHAASVLKNKTEFPGIERPTYTLGNIARKGIIRSVEKNALKREAEANAQGVRGIQRGIQQGILGK